MKTFTVSQRRDAFQVMQKALTDSGYVLEKKRADMAFIDREPTGNPDKWDKVNRAAATRPTFIYPHTPYAFWLWDGYTKPSHNIACNFVASQAAKLSMQAYGYPCRVEVVGYTRPLTISPFQPTSGNHLAYSPPRLMGKDLRWARPADEQVMHETMDWILRNKKYFERVTVFYVSDLEKTGLLQYKKYGLNFQCVADTPLGIKTMNTQTAIDQLAGVDLFIGSNTLGYTAMALGIPTILVGHDTRTLHTSSNDGKNYEKYAQFCEFPVNLLDLSAHEAKALCFGLPSAIEKWKELNIGTNFDKDAFLSVIKEY